ncbi:hypothetical protein EAG_09225 [Camponotus floridanus]|uniref:Uncharacterized protein n=1 Tax=Camponotus floridanus TaxID=104421 RepID=E2AL05_CAMFO|nr:hypothetical protein EAG_09225 [Camponotus floridanus]
MTRVSASMLRANVKGHSVYPSDLQRFVSDLNEPVTYLVRKWRVRFYKIVDVDFSVMLYLSKKFTSICKKLNLYENKSTKGQVEISAPPHRTRGGSIMQISQTRVVVVVIMYRVVGSERQKERQKEESDKGSAEKEMERESGKRHRVQASGVSLAAVSTPHNANEPPHPAKRIKEQQQSLDPSLTFHVDASLDLCLTEIVRPEERSRLVSQPWISSAVPSSNRVTQTKRESSETSRHALEPQHEEISVEAVQSDSGGSLARITVEFYYNDIMKFLPRIQQIPAPGKSRRIDFELSLRLSAWLVEFPRITGVVSRSGEISQKEGRLSPAIAKLARLGIVPLGEQIVVVNAYSTLTRTSDSRPEWPSARASTRQRTPRGEPGAEEAPSPRQ